MSSLSDKATNLTEVTATLSPVLANIFLIIWALSLIASFIGSLLIFQVIVTKYFPMMPATEKMIINLLVADFLFVFSCVAYMLPMAIENIPKPVFKANTFLCRFHYSLIMLSSFASALILAIIAYMRYIKLATLKFQRYFTVHNVRVISFSIWFIATLATLPALFNIWGGLIYYSKFDGLCAPWFDSPMDLNHLTYNILIMGFFFGVVNVLIFFCYYRIYKCIHFAFRRIEVSRVNNSDGKVLNYRELPSLRKRHKKEIKLNIILFIIFLGYVLSYGPAAVIITFRMIGLIKVNSDIIVVITTIMYSNSMLNPWIILLTSQHYRRFIKDKYFKNR
ncbi:putative G-protein coupled receptor 101 [Trichoplax sp. H2]|nr:putative G-protein coupled receptor 101 [Trichoplax sp. H2]|eukprot:RDD39211.1 putative G-protein coupled receptor 101 [Trichoplax sp. H2]